MVVLRARLTYTGDEPARRAFGWLSPLDLRLDQGSGSTVSVRDGSVDPPVQPGLPVDVYYVWNLADDEKVGIEVDEMTDEITGLYEFVPADEVKPRGE